MNLPAKPTDIDPEPLALGVTGDQFDELDRLTRRFWAHGDVVWAGNAFGLNVESLPALGETIHEAADAINSLLDRIEEQPLKAAPQHSPARQQGQNGESVS